MFALGGYDAFKLVDGHSVVQRYRNYPISVGNDIEIYSFPYHSAGPFGDDVAGEWLTGSSFFSILAVKGLGWKDIHASNVRTGTQIVVIETDASLTVLLAKRAKRWLGGILPPMVRNVVKRVLGWQK